MSNKEKSASLPIIDGIVGARPNLMKMAPLSKAIFEDHSFQLRIVHTGQHYDYQMSKVFFDELGLPEPYINLEVGHDSSHQHEQTAEIIKRYSKFLDAQGKPRGVVVVGDVNSTLACSLVAAKELIPIAHVEAGLRSFDKTMPEEINRKICDTLSDILFVSDPSGLVNLAHEGHPGENIFYVGNIMIDTLMAKLPKAKESDVLQQFKLKGGEYAFVTMHRPSNVDFAEILASLLNTLNELSRDMPVVFAVHPRTRNRMEMLNMEFNTEAFILTEPLSYVDNLRMMLDAWAVLTDSGGMQEECSVLKVPCLTLRFNTERPITTTLGSSELVGNDVARIKAAWKRLMEGQWRTATDIPLWDGHTARRIVQVLRWKWA